MSAADAELYSSVPNRQIFFDVKIDKIEIKQLKVLFNPAALWGEETEYEKPFRAGWCFFG